MTELYLHLFHGRTNPDQDMDDWGTDGPVIGPLRYVHGTYMSTIRVGGTMAVAEEFFPAEFARMKEFTAQYPETSSYRDPEEIQDLWLNIHEDMIEHNGVYYGDWSIGGSELKARDFNA